MENIPNLDLDWSISKKIAFRFTFIFFSLFIIIENNEAYPFWIFVMKYPVELLHKVIPWIGENLLHLPYSITVFTNGSGDTTYDYVIVLTNFAIAILGTVIWSLLDRKRAHYTILYYWLTVAVRFYVGLMLIQYGLYKIFKLQFPSPDLYRLTEVYGDSSPMGLAWTFLGFSVGYNIFMGIAELAAALLLFRRTMTIGAIITLMTTLNVMAINYFYDVPVKILSTMLFIMTLFLLLNDAGRLLTFFFTGKPISLPVIKGPVFRKKWLRVVKHSVKYLIMGHALIYVPIELWGYKAKQLVEVPNPKSFGLYKVNTFIMENDTLPPLTTDTERWNEFLIENEKIAWVRYMGDSLSRFNMKMDTILQTIDLSRRDTTLKCTFHYQQPSSEDLILTGTIKSDSVSITTKRRVKDLKNYRLIKRGFRWISETPFNR